MRLKQNDKLTFIINIHFNFGEAMSGGIVACHYLAYKLAERGHYVYMFTEPEYPHPNIHKIKSVKKVIDGILSYQWESFEYNSSNTVAIYNEIDNGNPFNSKNVTRWILYHSSKEIESSWGADDCIFNYMSFETNLKKIDGNLTVMDFHLDDLKNLENIKRSGFCHILHKDTPSNHKEIIDLFRSDDIGEWKTKGAYNYLRETLNNYSYFLTFDNNTFYSLAAALCGCVSIILNDNKYKSPENFRQMNPSFKYGVAYGISDIEWAISTKHLLVQHLLELEDEYDKSVDDFISFWEEKLHI